MEPKVMITNGGAHPPEKWAEISCAEIIAIPADSQSPQAQVGRRLELKVLDILTTYHEHVIAAERAQLDEDGDGRLESPLDGKEHDPEEVVTGIQEAAKGTEWEGWFKRPEIMQNIRNVLAHHAELAMDVERSWYVDLNPDSKAGAAWREAHNTLGRGLAHTFNEVK